MVNEIGTEPEGSSRTLTTALDYNQPLFLGPSDISGIPIIFFQLTGVENFSICFGSMCIALLGRNKLSIVDGTCSKDKFSIDLGSHWERVNAIVLSWIMNSASKELLGGIMYASVASVVWAELYERFHKIDGARTFNLHKEIATLSQGNASLSSYFSKLKDLWEEFEALVPTPRCKKPNFTHDPLPSINQAYAMVISDESHKATTIHAGILGTSPVVMSGNNCKLAMYTRHENGGSNPQKFKKNYNLQYDFCKLKGHTRETCWKLVGYPNDHKFKKKSKMEGSNAAYNVSPSTQLGHHGLGSCNQHARQGFQSHDTGIQVGFDVQMNQISQVGSVPFTKEQYEQILRMINSNNTGSHAEESTNAATTFNVGISAFSASVKSREWIIDMGATNHMVADLDLLLGHSTTKLDIPRDVYLPNGGTTKVTHVGSSCLSKDNVELYTGKVGGIGKPAGGLYLLVGQQDNEISQHAANKVTNGGTFTISNDDIYLGHRRLGHVSTHALKKIVTSDIRSIEDRIRKCTTTCAYTPQQNGVVERKHRHILEVTRVVRFQGAIPIHLWGYYVLAAVDIINRLLSSAIDYQVPYERFYGKKANYDHLKVLGCLCYAKVLNEHDKLMPRARTTVLTGYSNTQKGYVLYDISSKFVSVCRDVLFREDIFPFKVNKDQNKSHVHIFPLEDQFPVVGDVVTPLKIPLTTKS
ncbi:uncharacterized protein LOC124895477 [Capsicum annuum]|uniref:uncharacterized protein LOC107858959 n=1 Tax=Capsicum annuum TaxID=4072 RepID=UPI001FB05CF0|nr:uncharacterized protein LOC107858959 [Capsicum annuum]XP_047261880.1 uncharacterized protein LOC124895477 [Capsicum annuum]